MRTRRRMNDEENEEEELRPISNSSLVTGILLVFFLGSLVSVMVKRGVNNWTSSKSSEISQVNKAFDSFENALGKFKSDHGRYPFQEEGLVILLSPQPYLEQLPLDPWGMQYQYLGIDQGAAYTLLSLGADHLPGTEDDIRRASPQEEKTLPQESSPQPTSDKE